MNARSLSYDVVEMQDMSSWIREAVEDYGFDLVYCPMCEISHENNTNCQRND